MSVFRNVNVWERVCVCVLSCSGNKCSVTSAGQYIARAGEWGGQGERKIHYRQAKSSPSPYPV